MRKRVIKIVDKSSYNAHTEPMLKNLNNLPKLQHINLTHLGQCMFSLNKAILPRKFENIFTITETIKSIVTIQGMQSPFVYNY